MMLYLIFCPQNDQVTHLESVQISFKKGAEIILPRYSLITVEPFTDDLSLVLTFDLN